MSNLCTMHRALLALSIVLAGCWEPTSPARIRTVTLVSPGALDLNSGTRDAVPGPGRGNEVEIYLRSGAPWVASVPGIEIAVAESLPPSAESCAATPDWTFFETPVESAPAVSYVCVKTSEEAVTWMKLERVQGATDRMRVTFEVVE